MSEVNEVKDIKVLNNNDEVFDNCLSVNELKKDLDKLNEYKFVLKKTFEQLGQNIFNSYKQNRVIKNGTLAITLNNAIKNAIPKNIDEYKELASEYAQLWDDIFKLIGENKVIESEIEELIKEKECAYKLVELPLDYIDVVDIKDFIIKNNLVQQFYSDINEIERLHCVLKEQTNQLYVYGAWCDDVTKCYNELMNLITEMKIHKEHVSPYIFQGEIDEDEIKSCIKDTNDVINTKPNKLLTIFGVSNKWENKVFNALKKCEILRKNLETEIGFSNEIIRQNKVELNNANKKLSEFIVNRLCDLDNKIKYNESLLNESLKNFECLEKKYLFLKEMIINIFEKQVVEKENKLKAFA